MGTSIFDIIQQLQLATSCAIVNISQAYIPVSFSVLLSMFCVPVPHGALITSLSESGGTVPAMIANRPTAHLLRPRSSSSSSFLVDQLCRPRWFPPRIPAILQHKLHLFHTPLTVCSGSCCPVAAGLTQSCPEIFVPLTHCFIHLTHLKY